MCKYDYHKRNETVSKTSDEFLRCMAVKVGLVGDTNDTINQEKLKALIIQTNATKLGGQEVKRKSLKWVPLCQKWRVCVAETQVTCM